MSDRPQRTPARAVYDIPEIWRLVVSQMDLPTLAKAMRLEKRGMKVVAKELWGNGNKVADNIWGFSLKYDPDSTRAKIYKSAVSVFDAYSLVLPVHILQDDFHMPREVMRGDGCMQRRKNWFDTYRPEVITQMINLLVTRYTALSEIRFGYRSSYSLGSKGTWVVKFTPGGRRRPGRPAGDVDVRTIDHYFQPRLDINDPPVDETPPDPPLPKAGAWYRYSINCRYHVDLRKEPYNTPYNELYPTQWLQALKTFKVFGRLRQVDLGHLPVSLADISQLLERQSEEGRTSELEKIIADHSTSWGLRDFQQLARGLNASLLTELRLAYYPNSEDIRTTLTFSDLPALFSIISDHLPNLTSLFIPINGIESAESVCLPWLTKTSLDHLDAKPARTISLRASPFDFPLFNTTRYLASHFSDVKFYGFNSGEVWNESKQKWFMQYLRQASPKHRRYLADIDFSTIGVTTVEEMLAFVIDDVAIEADLIPAEVKGWAELAKEVKAKSEALVPDLETGVLDLSRSSRRLEAMAPEEGTTDGEKLAEAQKLLAAVKKVKEVSARAAKLLETDPEEEISRYIASLGGVAGT